jgi:hypothetical protein
MGKGRYTEKRKKEKRARERARERARKIFDLFF